MGEEGKPRILVVDDEASITKIVRKQLEVSGFEVLVAADGQEGLAKAREGQPDLMILDLMLPKMNGYDVCSAVKQDPQLRRIPIIMLTARTQRQDKEEALARGADAFVMKPFSLDTLMDHIRRLLPVSSVDGSS